MDPWSELAGQSPAVEAVRDTVRRLLARQQPGRRPPAILLQGETGTGKGLLARLIHRLGPRARGEFVDVNCAAIPETLLESELFGYERGAFTDARKAKPGLFQTAHLGTIFLDEVGSLPEALQAKLLTVIEERAVRRLGGTRPEPADAWIISATNADLQSGVRERRFREDLYHRLAVFTLRLPPLRERDGDVLMLAERFLARVVVALERADVHPHLGRSRLPRERRDPHGLPAAGRGPLHSASSEATRCRASSCSSARMTSRAIVSYQSATSAG